MILHSLTMIDNTFNEFALNELSFTMVFEYVIGIKILRKVRVRHNVTHDVSTVKALDDA